VTNVESEPCPAAGEDRSSKVEVGATNGSEQEPRGDVRHLVELRALRPSPLQIKKKSEINAWWGALARLKDRQAARIGVCHPKDLSTPKGKKNKKKKPKKKGGNYPFLNGVRQGSASLIVSLRHTGVARRPPEADL